MRHAPRRHYLLLGLIVLVLTMVAMPTQAAYTKLYRFTNNTATDKGGVRVVLNSLETTTADFVAPLQWGDDPYPAIANILFSGTYCTKLKWFGNPVPAGGVVKVGWTTADDSCRLRDLRWITTAGNLAGDVVGAEQLQGAPGGGQVTYDPELGGYIWTITNDTDQNIDLSNTQLSVLDTQPTLVELDAMLWPMDVLNAKQEEWPHPDIYGPRADAVIEDYLEPLRADVLQAQQDGYLSEQDTEDLVAELTAAIEALQTSKEVYDPSDRQPAMDQWAAATAALESFKALVSEIEAKMPILGTGPWSWWPSAWPHWMYVNDEGQVVGQAGVGGFRRAFAWDSTKGQDGFVLLHDIPPPEFGLDGGTCPEDINAAGWVVGWGYPYVGGPYRAVAWLPDGNDGYTAISLHPSAGWQATMAQGMNDNGLVVGRGTTDSGMVTPVLWQITGNGTNGWSAELVYQGDYWGAGIVVNNLGQWVKSSGGHLYRCDPGEQGYDDTPLEDPGADYGYVQANGINSSGYVAAYGSTVSGGLHALAWDPAGNLIHLHDPSAYAGAYGLNDLGQVVGIANSHAMFWDLSGPYPPVPYRDLHGSDWPYSSQLFGITNDGLVVGRRTAPDGSQHQVFVASAEVLPYVLPEELAQEWLEAADATIAAIGDLPGDAGASGGELPPPPDPPPLPPPPAGEPPTTYIPWDELQEQPEPTLPPDSCTAFVVQDEDGTPDETLMLVVQYPVIESVELYTASDPYNPPVGDTTPPVIADASITPDLLWPHDHRMVEMELNVQAIDTDDQGAQKPATWYIESVTSNQPENESGQGDGNTESDWLLDPDTDPQSLSLRAECSRKSEEARIYTVTVRAIDETGNLSDPMALEVRVEHGRGQNQSMIMTLAAAPGAAGAQVSFTLSCDAQVEAQVLNIAGRPIKMLATDRECEAGVNTLVWDGRSDRGLAVPAGAYLIRVNARTEDGQQASGLCSVMLRK